MERTRNAQLPLVASPAGASTIVTKALNSRCDRHPPRPRSCNSKVTRAIEPASVGIMECELPVYNVWRLVSVAAVLSPVASNAQANFVG